MTTPTEARDRSIRARLVEDASPEAVAEEYGVPLGVVRRIGVAGGLAMDRTGQQTLLEQPNRQYKPSDEALEVLSRISWVIADHVPTPPRCTRRDAALCESIILEDLTLDEAGDRADLTRERMRQILDVHTGLSTRDLAEHRAAMREARRLVLGRAAARRLADERPDATLSQLAERSGLTVPEVSELLGEKESLRRRARNTWATGISSESVLEELRRVAALPGGTPLTGPFYELHSEPGALSAVRILQRYGSWREACEAAGVPMSGRERVYDRKWSQEDLLDWVAAYVAEVGAEKASYARFSEWSKVRRDSGAPSAQTVRNYLGKWQDILTALADRS